ncbi:MAG: group 1 glycosyl transferase [Chloroflexi bacterium]|nr:MAG: group 1 glycosyl transferase [Chloroflexota bacterium]
MTMKIMFLIRSLGHGGAERQLVNLAQALRKLGHGVTVVTFYSGEWLEKELSDAGVPVWTLGKHGRWDIVSTAIKLVRLVHKYRPDILHSYLSTANLLALLPKACCPSLKLVWGVRASNVDFDCYDWFTRLSFQCECLLSKVADLIIANSHTGRDYHLAHGFPGKKMILIHNGINTDRFKRDEEAGKRLRREWGIEERETLIGHVGRLDPMKDHPTFLKAAALVAQHRKGIRFVCVGEGPERYREELHSLANKLGLAGRLIWAGTRRDMPAVYSALDVAVSSSRWGEGLPNVVAEAMACGVPCVVTDVGDSAFLVGEFGIVVKAGDPTLLAQGINVALTSAFKKSSTPLRDRVLNNFSVATCVNLSQQSLGALIQEKQ